MQQSTQVVEERSLRTPIPMRKMRGNALAQQSTDRIRQQKPQKTRMIAYEIEPPAFTPCVLRGPDGQARPGWELRSGDVLFGRADSQDYLLQYYQRLLTPVPSEQWCRAPWQKRRRNATMLDRAYVHSLLGDEEFRDIEMDVAAA